MGKHEYSVFSPMEIATFDDFRRWFSNRGVSSLHNCTPCASRAFESIRTATFGTRFNVSFQRPRDELLLKKIKRRFSLDGHARPNLRRDIRNEHARRIIWPAVLQRSVGKGICFVRKILTTSVLSGLLRESAYRVRLSSLVTIRTRISSPRLVSLQTERKRFESEYACAYVCTCMCSWRRKYSEAIKVVANWSWSGVQCRRFRDEVSFVGCWYALVLSVPRFGILTRVVCGTPVIVFSRPRSPNADGRSSHAAFH